MYQFLYQANAAGVYTGSHVIAKYGDLPKPVKGAEFPELIAEINAAAIARADELAEMLREVNSVHAAALSAVEAAHAQALAESKAECAAELATLKAEADKFRADATAAALHADNVIKDPAIDAARTITIVGEIVRQVLQPRVERELEAARKALADAQALVDALQGKGAA